MSLESVINVRLCSAIASPENPDVEINFVELALKPYYIRKRSPRRIK
jgi:hypothetical protein